MPKFDPTSMERVRRHPRWLARLANRLVGWTDQYCSGGCGYPVTGRFVADVDSIDDVPVQFLICSVDTDCEDRVLTDPRDPEGIRYSEVRPQFRDALRLHPDEVDVIRIAFTH